MTIYERLELRRSVRASRRWRSVRHARKQRGQNERGGRRGDLDDRRRSEAGELRCDGLRRPVVAGAHRRLAAVTRLLHRAVAVVGIRATAVMLGRHRAQLRDRHGERDDDRNDRGRKRGGSSADGHGHSLPGTDNVVNRGRSQPMTVCDERFASCARRLEDLAGAHDRAAQLAQSHVID